LWAGSHAGATVPEYWYFKHPEGCRLNAEDAG